MNPALPGKGGVNPALPKRWYYVYLVANKDTGQIYIGCTSNLRKRLLEHKTGKVLTTKKMLPLELLYFEGYISRKVAYKRERTLKYYGNSLAKLKSRIGIVKKGRAG